MDDLLVSARGRISLVTINRPRKANALTTDMQARLTKHLKEAGAEETIGALVITGGSGSVFCAGADVQESSDILSPAEFADLRSARMFELLGAVLTCPKPVVVALNGHAVGSGCLLAFVADARVAVAQASFSLPEILRGRPTFAGAAVVSRLLGDVAATDLVQTGRRMTFDEAARRGLISAAAEPDELVEKAVELAQTLARQGEAFALNKQWINEGFVERLAEAQRRSAEQRRAGSARPDAVPDASRARRRQG